MGNQMLEKEFKYFNDHITELIKEFAGKYIVIKDDKILGSYPTTEEALKETLKEHKAGSFLLQFVSPNKEDYTQKFYSRVMFASSNSH